MRLIIRLSLGATGVLFAQGVHADNLGTRATLFTLSILVYVASIAVYLEGRLNGIEEKIKEGGRK